jgi:hypothetical protein
MGEMPAPIPTLTLELAPVPDEDADAALCHAIVAAATYYGCSADIELPESDEGLAAELHDCEARMLKAVAAHPSHYQARRKTGRFAIRHPAATAPRDAGGRFAARRLDPAEQTAAARRASAEIHDLAERLSDHLFDFEAGHLSGGELTRRAFRDIARTYTECYRLGKQAAGDPAIRLNTRDVTVISRILRDEHDYLIAFADDLIAGRGTMPYHARMRMYAAAAREAAWTGYAVGDPRKSREVRWELGPTEHCRDCERFAAAGWMPIGDYLAHIAARGYAPQSGQLACKGAHCRCRLLERVNGDQQPPMRLPSFNDLAQHHASTAEVPNG